jgi:hypothetical protein
MVRRVSLNVLLALLSVVITILAIEIVMRILAPALPALLWKNLPHRIAKPIALSKSDFKGQSNGQIEYDDMFYHYVPNLCIGQVCLDEIGFRNPAGTYSDNEVIDIVTLGDSFTYGAGASQSWPDILRNETGLTVLNLGIGAVGSQYWVESFRRFGLAKNPRFVIVGTFDGNDFEDTARWSGVERAGGDFFDYWWDLTPPSSNKLVENSVVLTYLRLVFTAGPTHLLDVLAPKIQPSLALSNGLSFEVDYFHSVPDANAVVREKPGSGAKEYKNSLLTLKNMADSIGAKMVVMYFSSAPVVYAPYIIDPPPEVQRRVERNVQNQVAIADWLASLANQYGFCFVDTTPELRRRAASSSLLYNEDADHLSVAGNAAVVDILLEYLDETGLLPADTMRE